MPKQRFALTAEPPGRAEVARLEAPASCAPGAGWHPPYGSLRDLGFSFRWNDFELAQELDWSLHFTRGCLELCLNLDGQAALSDGRDTVTLRPRMSVFYFQGDRPLKASRRGGERHRFITVEFAADFLKRHLGTETRNLHGWLRALLGRKAAGSKVGLPEPMGTAMLHSLESLQRCPVFKSAQETWFRCKALELAAQLFFCPPEGELFCTRQQRVACERAARVREVLSARLADPPSLEELGRLVGCSSFYLSRQFSEATGLTIQQFLRQARLERAARLLRDGRHNVTEAALEVGYSSLSHFTVAFREAFGCCPGLYPLRTPAQRSAPDSASPPKPA